MKRLLSLLLVLITVVTVFAGCQGPAATQGPGKTQQQQTGKKDVDEWGRPWVDSVIPDELDFGGQKVNILLAIGSHSYRDYYAEAYNDDIINAMRSGGMEYSRTVNSTNSFNIPKDFMVWNPTCHHNADLLGLLEKFHSISWIDIPLFYIWGHSYEFDRDNNWDKIEEFCEKASGHEDVWYATNIELVDYINALKQIRFSWNRRLAYNPTVTDVWVQVGSEAIKIGAGETVDLGEEATK